MPPRRCAVGPTRPAFASSPLATGVIERVADTVTPQPVLAVLPMLEEPPAGTPPWQAGPGSLVVVLVDVRDPGNAGTVLRTADASGVEAVVFAADTVDPYNPKTVRASAGSLFHVPFAVRHDPGEVAADLGAAGFRTLAAVVRDGDDYAGVDWSVASTLFLGNESAGLRSRAGRRARRRDRYTHGRSGRVAQRGRGQCRASVSRPSVNAGGAVPGHVAFRGSGDPNGSNDDAHGD